MVAEQPVDRTKKAGLRPKKEVPNRRLTQTVGWQ
jgi:hypothetical protein